MPAVLLRHCLIALFASVAAACGSGREAARDGAAGDRMPANRAAERHDDDGVALRAAAPPRRIVSLNPTTTEILFALGAGPRVVGRTHWDIWPEAARQVPDLGNGIQPNVETILGAHPDLVILYASADNRRAADRLRASGIPTYSFRVDQVDDFYRVAMHLGVLVGDSGRARLLADSVRRSLQAVRAATATLPHPRVVLPMFDTPLYVIGGGSYLSELVAIAGGRNVYDSLTAPSPQVSLEDVLLRAPQVILVGPETKRHMLADPRWRVLPAVSAGRVLTLDTNLVLRPGPRLGEAARSIAALLHPGVQP
ncbi:MAG: ABC transporter substrate-binding protein [Gemmatimonadaceae bacterium]